MEKQHCYATHVKVAVAVQREVQELMVWIEKLGFESVGREIGPPEKYHHEIYKCDQWKCENICTLCEKYCNQEKHTE